MRPLVLLTLGLILVTGCGGPSTARRGAAVFRAHCSACHTIDGRERAKSGGDLSTPVLSVADLESFARVMPGGRLSKDNLHAVAVYLHGVTAARARP